MIDVKIATSGASLRISIGCRVRHPIDRRLTVSVKSSSRLLPLPRWHGGAYPEPAPTRTGTAVATGTARVRQVLQLQAPLWLLRSPPLLWPPSLLRRREVRRMEEGLRLLLIGDASAHRGSLAASDHASPGFMRGRAGARNCGFLDLRPAPMEIALRSPPNIGGLRSQGGVEVPTGGNCEKSQEPASACRIKLAGSADSVRLRGRR